MDEFLSCPQCGAPARITERFWLAGTAGPVEHLKTGCVNHHWLTPLAETLTGTQPNPTPGAAQPAPAGAFRHHGAR
jgi:hypothetical protein